MMTVSGTCAHSPKFDHTQFLGLHVLLLLPTALSLSLDQDHYNISEGGGSVAVRVVSSQPAMDDTMVFLLVSDGSAVSEYSITVWHSTYLPPHTYHEGFCPVRSDGHVM